MTLLEHEDMMNYVSSYEKEQELKTKGDWGLGIGFSLQWKNYGIRINREHILEHFPSPQSLVKQLSHYA